MLKAVKPLFTHKMPLFEYMLLSFGSLCIAMSVIIFFKHGHIAVGGPIGLSILLKEAYGINLSLSYLLINICFFIIGYKKYGAAFFIKSMYATVFVSLSIHLFSYVFDFKHLDLHIFLAAIYSGVLFGAGVGIVIVAGGSPGAWTTMAKLISSLLGTNIGIVVFTLDITIILLLSFVGLSWYAIFLGMGSLLVSVVVIEVCIYGLAKLATRSSC
ncbi:YitT family protein [Pseudoalteromonas umbrosa]|uniref:YitT family protein n=1 Tax=Pseudoalteromonas umbrosa TaxID=3048489 RepID=UPI0024C3B1F2|nr:YitT family protein [Pseudoalteromonas sp. B95]MDK1288836.1 YitT family protein [Pseudoalteromonas sp. B95]